MLRGSRATFPLLGVVALASGIAVLAYLVAGISLRFGAAVAIIALASAFVFALRRSDPSTRRQLLGTLAIGATAGISATLAYDTVRMALSYFDPSPYDPLEAVHAFGILLAGADAGATVIMLSGGAFHLLNGVSFGVGYCFLSRRREPPSVRRALAQGIAWGLFLESFQLTLYPGWLDIRAYREFVQISAVSHVVYGAVLGLGARYLQGRQGREGAG